MPAVPVSPNTGNSHGLATQTGTVTAASDFTAAAVELADWEIRTSEVPAAWAGVTVSSSAVVTV